MGIVLPPVAPEDQKFVVATPDAGFDPRKNKMVIDECIREYEAMRKKKLQQSQEGIGERSDAVATYIKSNLASSKDTPVQRYFGRRWLAYLRGDQIKDELMKNMTIFGKSGKLIKKSGDAFSEVIEHYKKRI